MKDSRLILLWLVQLFMDYGASTSRWRLRLAGAGMSVLTIFVFVIACSLQPDARGYGTHEQLGLPACQFYSLTGVLCPHCGMTTSFAHTVRGNLSQAVKANPCGPPLVVVLTTLVLPWSLGATVFGRSPVVKQPVFWMLMIGAAYVTMAAVIWVVRVFL